MAQNKLHVKSGDTVRIIAGDDKGTEGAVIRVDTKKLRVYVEGAKMQKKALKKSQANPDGGIVEVEGPIHVSNVKKLASAQP